jgi:hypothetical protein
MLPYRLRAPEFGSKLFKDKERQANSGQNQGNPVKGAIQQDLLRLQTQFQEALVQQRDDALKHSEEGVAFSKFQSVVFSGAKVSLPQTQITCSRCDRGNYSQLIYDACLQSLEDAVFCLYGLAENERLLHQGPPVGATGTATAAERNSQYKHKHKTETETALALLPMDLTCHDNPKNKFRRTYCHPIRMDRFQYALLLRLREEAMARHSDCEHGQVQARLDRLLHRRKRKRDNPHHGNHPPLVEHEHHTSNYACHCGQFCDLNSGPLGDRFLRVSLSSASGPFCLEGLVCRMYYQQQPPPKNVTRTTRKDMFNELPVHQSKLSSHATTILSDIHKYQSCPLFMDTSAKYLDWLKKKVAPSLQQSALSLKRLTSCCKDSLSGQATIPTTTTLQVDEQGEEETRVGDSANNSNNKGASFSSGAIVQNQHAGVAVPETLYNVVLPTQMSMSLRNGIQSALRATLARDPPTRPASSGGDVSVARAKGDNASRAKATKEHVCWEQSSHGNGSDVMVSNKGSQATGNTGPSDEEESVAQSSNTGYGGAALGALMSRVMQAPAGSGNDDESVAQSSNTGFGGAAALNALMSTVSQAAAKIGAHEDEQGTVGQSINTGYGGAAALDALMSRVSLAAAKRGATDEDGSFGQSTNGGYGGAALDALISRVSQPKGGATEEESSVGQSTNAGHGGAALDALMARVSQVGTKAGTRKNPQSHRIPTQIDFLSLDEDRSLAPDSDAGDEVSILSDLEDEDALQMAESAAWDHARSNRKQSQSQENPKRKASAARTAKRAPASILHVRGNKRRRKSSENNDSKNAARNDGLTLDESPSADGEDSLASSARGQGRSAIELLLSQVEEA